MPHLSLLPLLPLLLAVVEPVLCAVEGPVTIDQSDIYRNQRVCAFPCFEQFDDPGYPIAGEIQCANFKVQNDCFCRPDLQQSAHQFVYSCISNGCRNSLDLSIATKLYDDYCTSNGYTQTTTTTAPAPSETGALTITITVPPTVVVTATATVTVTAAAASAAHPGSDRWTGWATRVVPALLVAILAARY